MKNNYKKIILFIISLIFVGFLFLYVPFFNSFFGPSIGLVAVFWFWFLLFHPRVSHLVLGGMVISVITGFFSMFQLDVSFFGDIIFSIMIFILIRFFHEFILEN